MAQQAKGGYEKSPLLADAEAGVQEPAPRKWHGHLLAPCGPSCDALGWSTCLVTHYFPAITFGLNSRKAFNKSALRAGLVFATLTFLSWAHYAIQMQLMNSECLADAAPPRHDGPRRMGPAFAEANGAFEARHAHHWAAKPFGRPLNADKAAGEQCTRLVQTAVLLNVATLVYALALFLYGASLRTAMRRRYGIEGSRCADCLAWTFCAPCSMCQEARTLAVNNVEHGTWHGATPDLPVMYFAAAETQAPSVPVMSADVVKPPKA